ncbi:hypothetical protein EVAR_48443_1 [Eumeta japonica]|uniref:Uncharacterized protein n=1 Tax=Eumeta variegata TaxID=151549 RepID=A0A4C1XRF1_EUMVA|nr:hypothetical protein EVAR_48443_1 [Eumeta japonica]
MSVTPINQLPRPVPDRKRAGGDRYSHIAASDSHLCNVLAFARSSARVDRVVLRQQLAGGGGGRARAGAPPVAGPARHNRPTPPASALFGPVLPDRCTYQ